MIAAGQGAARTERVIVLVWDGMRPDFVTEELTPNLCALARDGSRYRRATGVFPSVTRPTTSSVSTGTYPATHGVIGNLFVGPPGDRTPLDTGDRTALERLRAINGGRMLPVQTLAEALAAAGKRVVVLGSGTSGQAPLLDPERAGTTIHVTFTEPGGLLATLTDRFGPPPAKTIPVNPANDWLNRTLIEYVLPELAPDVAIMWQCEPDASQHAVGLGAPATLDAIRGNDARLGRLLAAIAASGVPTTLIVASDHGHNTVTGMVRTQEALADAGFGEDLRAGRILVAEQALTIEPGPRAAELRAAVGAWLAAQPWVGALIAWEPDGAPAGALPPGAVYGPRERAGFPHAPTFTFSHAWDAAPNEYGAPGSANAGFVESMADFARLQGAIVGLNRLTATHGTLGPYDQNTVLILSGARIRPGEPDLPAGVIDLAPTVLALLGLPPLPDADGRALTESFTDGPAAATVAVTTTEIATLPGGGTLHRHTVGDTAYIDTGLSRP
jgi:phosphonoacetate hydrolase